MRIEDIDKNMFFDVVISVDVASKDRMTKALPFFENANGTSLFFCLDLFFEYTYPEKCQKNGIVA